MSLKALAIAATCIPLDGPTTGISHVTPYLDLLDALDGAVQKVNNIVARGTYVSVAVLEQLRLAAQLSSDLRDHHRSSLCTRRRGYKTSSTAEPRLVRFSGDSARVFVGTHESATWVLETVSGISYAISTARLPSGFSFYYANFTRDGQHVFWGSREGPVYLLPADTGEPVRLEGVGYGQRSRVAAVSHDETCVLVVSATNSAALCDAATGETLRTFTGHSKRVCRAAFASVLPPRKQVSNNNQEVNTVTPTVESDELEPLMELKRPPVATTSCDNTVRIWDVDTGSCITIFNDLGSAVNGVSWSSDATMLAITSTNTVRVYETATRDLKCALDGHTKLVCDVTFSPNGQLLASASDDHTVRIWNYCQKDVYRYSHWAERRRQ
ncbi:quinon protein alcohol dehydrogenase-like superfamily [Mycena rebaudengoi]|nr:quinon protein alcohol dehydrogenase-like superfamily [Mycena rebaudengoi]